MKNLGFSSRATLITPNPFILLDPENGNTYIFFPLQSHASMCCIKNPKTRNLGSFLIRKESTIKSESNAKHPTLQQTQIIKFHKLPLNQYNHIIKINTKIKIPTWKCKPKNPKTQKQNGGRELNWERWRSTWESEERQVEILMGDFTWKRKCTILIDSDP